MKEINSNIVNELFKCQDCQYAFNSRSGTILHGSKLKPNLILQLIVYRDHCGEPLVARDISQKLMVTDQTARSLIKRHQSIPIDRSYFCRFTKEETRENMAFCPIENLSLDLNQYFHKNSICIDPALFRKRVASYLSIQTEAFVV